MSGTARAATELVDWSSLPRGVRTVEHEWVPMRDGARLAARLFLPEDAAARPVPAILEYIPYRKRDLTRDRDEMSHPWLAGHGYAGVRIDLRGSGDSDGILHDQYLDQEHEDGFDAVEWIAKQPWCDGRVAMMGLSWGGFAALQVAATQPPSLGAVIAACATDDLYRDNMHYMGGCLLSDNLSEATTMFAFNSCPPDPEIVGAAWREAWRERLRQSRPWLDIWLRHQRRDDFWKRASVCEDYGAIRCPVFVVSGWADGYTNAVFRLLERLDVPRRGLVGPWGHDYPHRGIPGPRIGFLQEVVRFLDRHLVHPDGSAAGEERPRPRSSRDGTSRDDVRADHSSAEDVRSDRAPAQQASADHAAADDEPMLRVWMQDSVPPTTRYETRPGRWVAEDSWPSPRIDPQRWSLAPAALVPPGEPARGLAAAPSSVQSPLSLGLFAGKWCSYAATPDLPHDQRQEDGGALVFDSPPLDAPLEILGAAYVELELSVDQPIALVAARLSDVRPSGAATRVTFGLRNLAHRRSHEELLPMEPGRFERVGFRLNDVAQSFPAGSRLRLALSTSYWPLAWPPPRPVRLDVRTAGSFLELPVRPPRAGDESLRRFEPALGTRPTRVERLEEGPRTWRVHRDLATDVSELEVVKDLGRKRLADVDLEVRDAVWETYRSRGEDFASPEGETRTLRELARGSWRVRISTRTLLDATPSHFRLRAELDAWEGETRVHSANWDETIPRDHV